LIVIDRLSGPFVAVKVLPGIFAPVAIHGKSDL
jgi:hypothetical protein